MVPVEEWKERNEKDNEIDLIELTNHVWHNRKFVFKVTGIFVVIGILIALLSPVEYETEATLLPETRSAQSIASGLLEQYGGLLGIGGGTSLGEAGDISPQLYPQIVQSLPFQLELLNKEVTFSEFDTTVTVYQFFNEVYTPSIFSYVLGYTIGLPGKIKGLFRDEVPEQPLPKGFKTDSVLSLTKNQIEVIKNMEERVIVSLDEESGIIDLLIEMPDPNAAAELGKTSIALIREYVTNYRIRKVQADLEFAKNQMQKAKKRFEKKQLQLAEFRDRNVNLSTAKAQTQEQRLQSEYDLTFNVYNSLAQQVEQTELRVQEQTPVVSVLQPVQIPIEKSSPQRKIIVVAALLIGLVGAVGFLLLKECIFKLVTPSPSMTN